MSDHSTSIVPKISNYPNREEKARLILDWLVSLDIVKPTISNCTFGPEGGYAMSQGAKRIVYEPKYLDFEYLNGLEIVTERTVFHNGGNGLDEVICPHCHSDVLPEGLDFIDEWFNGNKNHVQCPLCKAETDIQAFKFSPEWGFSDFGFVFCSWGDFTEDFIRAFEKHLDCRVAIVHNRI